MNSPHQREQLPDLLSDALTSTERARVESHLAECEQCARELRALQQMQQTLATLPAATPPASLRANVRAALRETPKQAWAWPTLSANRAGKALPFALPARQLAWGGAVALSAVGLMLLARPSLQNDTLSQSAPISETQLADRAAPNASTDAATEATDAPKTAKNGTTKSPVPASAPKPKTRNSGASGQPKSVDALPPLPAPPPLPQPRPRVPPGNAAPIPPIEMPAFEAPREIAPAPKIAPNSGDNTTKKQAGTFQKPALPKPQQKDAPARKVSPQANDASQSAIAPPPFAPDSARDNSRPPGATTRDTTSMEAPPPLPSSQRDDRSDGAADFAPPAPVARAVPAAPSLAPALAKQSQAEAVNDWPGGAVEAKISAAPKVLGRASVAPTAPVLTLGVDMAIGNARLILLLPGGEKQVWRGSLNAAPVEIPLGKVSEQIRSGQKTRARLEQIDGEGNPKSSTTFELLWP